MAIGSYSYIGYYFIKNRKYLKSLNVENLDKIEINFTVTLIMVFISYIIFLGPMFIMDILMIEHLGMEHLLARVF